MEWVDRGVGKGFLKDETSPTVKIHSTLFQKRQPKPPCEQVDANATTFGKSTAGIHSVIALAANDLLIFLLALRMVPSEAFISQVLLFSKLFP